MRDPSFGPAIPGVDLADPEEVALDRRVPAASDPII